MAIKLPCKLPGKTVQTIAQRNPAADEFDVTCVQDDGSVWHIWYRGKAGGWFGPEHVARPAGPGEGAGPS